MFVKCYSWGLLSSTFIHVIIIGNIIYGNYEFSFSESDEKFSIECVRLPWMVILSSGF